VRLAFAVALTMLPGVAWSAEERDLAPIADTVRSDSSSNVVVLTLTHLESPTTRDTESLLPGDSGAEPISSETCQFENTSLSLVELPQIDNDSLRFAIAPRAGHEMSNPMGDSLARAGIPNVDLVSFVRKKMLPKFATAYHALLKRIAMMGLPRIENMAAFAHTTIIGTISTYNPYRDGREEGGPQTASGEPYDPGAWTAAIKTDLRNHFGGVRYGRLYQPTFALVQSGAKQLIVKINDVGPLRPGRVLDLNERSMRHFDPFLTRGLLEDAIVTLLPGEDWTPGPVGTAYAIDLLRDEQRPLVAEFGPTDATALLDSEMARWHAPVGHAPYSKIRNNVRAEPGRAKAAKLQP
jgi:rare lipoprotein A